jgi:hypothetical protein
MRMKKTATWIGLLIVAATSGMMGAPMLAIAQSRQERVSQRRQKTKNEWRNIGIGSAAVGLYGLVKHDRTLTFVGAAGALYSANRYEQDRKSQNKARRARAEMFRRKSFYRNGHHYVRRTVKKNGHSYYQYVRR